MLTLSYQTMHDDYCCATYFSRGLYPGSNGAAVCDRNDFVELPLVSSTGWLEGYSVDTRIGH